jgi:hypothetical protein
MLRMCALTVDYDRLGNGGSRPPPLPVTSRKQGGTASSAPVFGFARNATDEFRLGSGGAHFPAVRAEGGPRVGKPEMLAAGIKAEATARQLVSSPAAVLPRKGRQVSRCSWRLT